MRSWVELSEWLFRDARYTELPTLREAIVRTQDDVFTAEHLAVLRACSPATAAELAHLLRHAHHRHMVKLLVFTAEHVPEPLLRPMLLAAVHTRDPTYNKHFVFPCVLEFGRRRVVTELITIAQAGDDGEKAGAAAALYWGSMRREHTYWPHNDHEASSPDIPNDDVDDLLEGFAVWSVEEFLRNEDLDVRRAFVHYIPAVRARYPSLAQAAIDLVREHPDDYLRARLRCDLGESSLFPCLPPRGGDPEC